MSGAPIVHTFTEELEALLAKYSDSGITVAETVGALVLVAHSTMHQQDEEEGPDA